MPLSYAQFDTLTTTAAFLARVRTAVAKHAAYWQINVGATGTQKDWATIALRSGRCAQIAANLARELVMDPAFATTVDVAAADVTDAAIQTAVDAICEKYS